MKNLTSSIVEALYVPKAALAVLRRDAVLRLLAAAAREAQLPVYLVGGALRDMFWPALRRAWQEWDFAVARGAVEFARQCADRLGGSFILLDQDTQTARVVYQGPRRRYECDFADFRAASLRGDLRRRDFTVNTLWCDVQALVGSATRVPIRGVSGAGADIAGKWIRVAGRRSLVDDPVRILRAFSLVARCGVRCEAATLRQIMRRRDCLPAAAAERLRDELAKILSAPRAAAAVRGMEQAGLWPILFPETAAMRGLAQGGFHHLDCWQHSLAAMAGLDRVARQAASAGGAAARRLREYLREPVSGNRPRIWLLKLAALLHDVGKPHTATVDKAGRRHFYGHGARGAHIVAGICRRLKLSARETAAVRFLVAEHLRPGQLVNRRPSRKAQYRFVRDSGEHAVALILLALADRRAMRGPLSRAPSFVFYEDELVSMLRQLCAPPVSGQPAVRLLDGHEVMALIGAAPGPVVGNLLTRVAEAQALGQVCTKEQAAVLVRRIYRAGTVVRQ
ncbi:MAG: HD domain-containing protein [Candidatus Omnitrophica bacterium]|nr:HD domain-containing protein [Candidatus Omnitrophota bacterium]